jgi:hypothetical protein
MGTMSQAIVGGPPDSKTLTEWSLKLNINRSTLNMRIRRGWSIEKAFKK